MFGSPYEPCSEQYSLPLARALQLVGDSGIYQKRRLFWISIMLISYSVLNSYLPLRLGEGYMISFFFFAGGAGQLLCPMYLSIPTIVKTIIGTSIIAAITVGRIQILQFISFIVLGFLGRGLYVSSVIYINEIGGQKFRGWSFMIVLIVWGSAPFTLALLQLMSIPDWLWIFSFVTIPHSYVYHKIKNNCWHNSPFYYSEYKDDYKNARQVLNLIASQNGHPWFPYRLQGQKKQSQYQFSQNSQKQMKSNLQQEQKRRQATKSKKYTHIDLIFMPGLKSITIPLAVIWFYRQFVYYGSFMMLPLLGAEENRNLILLSISQLIAAVLSVIIKLHVKRINAFFAFTCCVGFSAFLVSFFVIPESCYNQNHSCIQKYIYQFSSVLIRFFICLLGSLLMNYTIEVYPTKVRKLGFGICLAAASAGSFAMPLLIQILINLGLSPFLSPFILSIPALWFLNQLPQTNGKMTSERLSEMDGIRDPIMPFSFLGFY